MEDKAVLEEQVAKGRSVAFRMRQNTVDAAVNGRQIGREAVAVLLESGLVDVRFSKYTISPMSEALSVYSARLGERTGGSGDDGGQGLASLASVGSASPAGAHDLENSDEDDSLYVIRALLARGCHPDDSTYDHYSDRSTQTTFLQAIATRDVAVVKLMLENGATVNYPSTRASAEFFSDEDNNGSGSSGSTAAAEAACKAHFLSGLSRTPLQTAVEVNSPAIVDLLLNPDKYCSQSSLAGDHSSSTKWPPADADAPAAHNRGATALQIAAGQGNCGIAATLLAHGADINAPPAKVWGRTALEAAADGGRLEMVDFLRANGYVFDEKGCERAIRAAEGNGEAGCAARIREI
ncbi:ankyrin repeat-containing domain protein, partial [Microdochium bolleyi]